MNKQTTYCGYVALIGRPNVGKSTLLNEFMRKKLSIISSKPQTTRHRLLGVKTDGEHQTVFVDTPGIHESYKKALNRYMNKAAKSALYDVDLILFLLDSDRWTQADEAVAQLIEKADAPVIVVVNKVDTIKNKDLLLPYLQRLQARFNPLHLVPISAEKGENVDNLYQLIKAELPEGPHLFPEEDTTDRQGRFFLAEMIREKLFWHTNKELPYDLSVQIESTTVKNKVQHINAIIYVEREGQKRIIIGEKGHLLKKVGEQARRDMEDWLGCRVFLRLWVKVKSDWSNNDSHLKTLGYSDE